MRTISITLCMKKKIDREMRIISTNKEYCIYKNVKNNIYLYFKYRY